MKLIIVIFCFAFSCCGQNKITNKVKLKLIFDKNKPIRGATILIKNSKPPIGTESDMNGNAVLDLENIRNMIVISFLGPYIEFPLEEPVDSVFLDLSKKKVFCYYQKKRTKKYNLN